MRQKQRESIRLPGYDYSQYGWYFVTICTKDREELFGVCKEGKTVLNPLGLVVEHAWHDILKQFPSVQADEFVVTPNHVYGIIVIGDDRRGAINRARTNGGITRNYNPMGTRSLGEIVRWSKGRCAFEIRRRMGMADFQWQRNYTSASSAMTGNWNTSARIFKIIRVIGIWTKRIRGLYDNLTAARGAAYNSRDMPNTVTASPKMVSLRVDVPEDVYAALRDEADDIAGYLRKQVALNKYREGKISMGKAAEIAGMPLVDFLHLMGQHKLSPFRFTPEEWEEEVKPL